MHWRARKKCLQTLLYFSVLTSGVAETKFRSFQFDDIAYAEQNVAEQIRQIYTLHSFEQRVVACPEQKPFRIWLAPFAEVVRQFGHGGQPGYKERFAGGTAAVDYHMKKHWMFTAGFSYAASDVKAHHVNTKADFRTYAGSLGTVWSNSEWFFDAILSYQYSPIHAHRKVEGYKATHHDHSNQGLVHLGGGYAYSIPAGKSASVKIYPFFNVDYLFSYQAGYREHGAQSFNLKVGSKQYDLLRPEGGAGIGYHGCFKHIEVLGNISASYVLEYRYTGKHTHVHFEDGSGRFTLSGLNPQNNVICPTARLRLASPAYGLSLTLGYHGEFGDRFTENAVEAELRKSF